MGRNLILPPDLWSLLKNFALCLTLDYHLYIFVLGFVFNATFGNKKLFFFTECLYLLLP